ncbi:MAG: response regulator [Spirochaetes bacterium]|nr:response regulator [Spirochaetota bacterium]
MEKIKILIVEDERISALYLSGLLKSLDYRVLDIVDSGKAAVAAALNDHPDLILMDIILDGSMDGIEAAVEIHQQTDIPIIFISAFTDEELIGRAKEASPYGYIVKPFEKRNLSTVISLSLHKYQLERSLNDSLAKLQVMLTGALHAIGKTVEFRDPYTAGHQRRVGNLSRAIAVRMGLPPEQIEAIYIVATIHDIGKISVPSEILAKPTRLSEAEFLLIKEHPLVGYQILSEIELPRIFSEVVYQHHERIDGSGYPRNLKKGDILLESRIVSVSDVVESMSSHRPYRPSLGLGQAIDEIENNSGIIYDSEVVDACCALLREGGFSFENVE